MGQLPIALELAREADVEHKWKTVGDAALAAWDISLAAECFKHAKDLGSLLLLHSSTGDRDGLRALSEQAEAGGSHNVSFSCLWQLGDVDACIDLLIKTNRAAEAVLFAQTYKPSAAARAVEAWKKELEEKKKGRVAKILGVPGQDEDLFPEWEEWLDIEANRPHQASHTNGIEELTDGLTIEDVPQNEATPESSAASEENLVEV